MNIQPLDMVAGETRTFSLAARDASNAVKSLSGLTVSWRVGRGPYDPNSDYPVITKTGSVVSASAGTFTVSVTASDTEGLQGDFLHQAVTSDGLVVVEGRLHIRPRLASS